MQDPEVSEESLPQDVELDKDGKKIVFKVEPGMNPQDILCTTYQMRNFFRQFADGFFSNLDVMNYIQHHKAALLAKKDMVLVDVCCGRSLMLPLLRYHAKTIKSYTGVDICEKNIREAKSRSGIRKLEEDEYQTYYPFNVNWIQSNVAEMAQHIEHRSVDFIIYTSAIEHMHKDHGYQSLIECYKIMSDTGFMFLSCPNTPGNGYNTQYAAHVYEWGYDELKQSLDEIGFQIDSEVGLVAGARELEDMYKRMGGELHSFYLKMKQYMPTAWLTAFMAVPFPEMAKEVLFIVTKKTNKGPKQKSLF